MHGLFNLEKIPQEKIEKIQESNKTYKVFFWTPVRQWVNESTVVSLI